MDTIQVVGFACGACGRWYRTPGFAEDCCRCHNHLCREPSDRWTYCKPCREAGEALREQRSLAKAEDVTASYDGPVWLRGQFYYHLDYLMDMYADEEPEIRPEWAFCSVKSPIELDAGQIVENAEDSAGLVNCDPEMEISRDGFEAFEAACEAYVAANPHNYCWDEDRSRKVRLDWSDAGGTPAVPGDASL